MSASPGKDERRPLDKGAAQCRETAKATDVPIVHRAADNGVPVEHPAPEVSRRPAAPREVPTVAAMFAEAASADGWAVQCTYARGTKIDFRGRPGKVVDSIAVRLRRGPDRAVGVWVDGAFTTGWSWRADPVSIPVAVKFRPLLALVAGAGETGQSCHEGDAAVAS